ncbi:MAG: hypothetical protein MR960_05330 [Prevotella sp.]|nr:hypothetical protein [Prevotella sp.]
MMNVIICNGYIFIHCFTQNGFVLNNPFDILSLYANESTNPLNMKKNETPHSPPKSKLEPI